MSQALKKSFTLLKNEVAGDEQRERELCQRIQDERREMEAEMPMAVVVPVQEQNAYDQLDEASAQLNEDASDYIHVLFWLMSAAKYSEKSRSWVVAILAYIDRHNAHKDGAEITDVEMADFMNCSERTVQRRRADYIKESRGRLQILKIIEGDYDKTKERNRPTRYRFACDVMIGDAVLEARSSRLWASDYREALKKAAFAAYDAEQRALSGRIPNAHRRRTKKELGPDAERGRICKTLCTLTQRLRDLESKSAADYSDDWEQLKADMNAIYYGTTDEATNFLNSPQAVGEKELNPMGRQTVVPSPRRDIYIPPGASDEECERLISEATR